jgi:hypothetical protein
MVQFTTTILKFDKKGEKTGWTYIEVPADIAEQLKPGNKKSFRVKGKLDNYSIKGIALLPVGNGNFIMPLNATMRKGIGKRQGAMLQLQLEIDKAPVLLNVELMECLADEPDALRFFKQLAKSHQNYFSKWIESAKTEPTKTKRITQTVIAMSKKQDFGQMLRSLKDNRR